jgi:lysozyme
MKADEFLKKKEGFKEQAYIDGAGKPTIGYGFTTINGKPVKMGDTITREEADAELQKQIGKYQSFKNKVKVTLTEDQETALTSFEYNLGGGVWNTTGKAIIHSINAGDFEEAARLMLQYNKAKDPKTGKLRVLPGLTSRRQEEGNLLMAQQGE